MHLKHRLPPPLNVIFYFAFFVFATFFEKKVAPKNFQREVFSAHCALDGCAAIIDCFWVVEGADPYKIRTLDQYTHQNH